MIGVVADAEAKAQTTNTVPAFMTRRERGTGSAPSVSTATMEPRSCVITNLPPIRGACTETCA
jgi:hypothetical protein